MVRWYYSGLRVYLSALWLLVVSMNAGYTQEVQQVTPFFLPKVIAVPGTYYIVTQGGSRYLESRYKISSGSLSDSSLVIYEFFPAQGIFKVVTRSAFVRSFFGAAYYNGKIVIAGGYNANGVPTQSVFEFDLSMRKWHERKSVMLHKRAEFALEVWSNTLYAIYGDEKGTVEAFNETSGKWQVVSCNYAEGVKPLKSVRGSVAIENYVYLFADEGICQVYNVSAGKISNVLPPPVSLSFFSVIGCNRKIYMAAGASMSGIDYNVYQFNTLDNTWKNAGKISVDLCGSGLVCYGRMLIFVGGSSTNMFEQTTPIGNIFIYRPMY